MDFPQKPVEESADQGGAVSRRLADAVDRFVAAAAAALDRGDAGGALILYTKAESIAPAERRVEILRESIPLHVSQGAFSRAFQLAREVLEYYCANGMAERATSLFEQLPDLGERDPVYRAQLREQLEQFRDGDQAQGSWLGTGSLRTPNEDFSRLTVLLVEDDPVQRELYCRAIDPLGCAIVCAANGAEALERIAERRPSLIISDLMMPTMNGSHLFERLQADPATETIPFVCMSARAEEPEIVAALRFGVEDYWTKPLRVREFQARVHRLLRRIKDEGTLTGDLAEIGVADLLQMLESSGRTGSLTLESRSRAATIYFVDGRPIDAVVGDKQGEIAVFAVIDWREGRFRFSPRPCERPTRIFSGTQSLLVDAAYRLDESSTITSLLPENLGTRLVFVTDVPAIEMFPPEASLEDFGRLRWLLDGRRTLGDVLADLAGELGPTTLLAALFDGGQIKDIGPEPLKLTE